MSEREALSDRSGKELVLVDAMNGSADYKIAVFTEALQFQGHERAAYLEHACGGDAELRSAIEALLQEHDCVGDFLEKSPPAAGIKEKAEAAGTEKPGDIIDGYKLLQQIGEGGCGTILPHSTNCGKARLLSRAAGLTSASAKPVTKQKPFSSGSWPSFSTGQT